MVGQDGHSLHPALLQHRPSTSANLQNDSGQPGAHRMQSPPFQLPVLNPGGAHAHATQPDDDADDLPLSERLQKPVAVAGPSHGPPRREPNASTDRTVSVPGATTSAAGPSHAQRRVASSAALFSRAETPTVPARNSNPSPASTSAGAARFGVPVHPPVLQLTSRPSAIVATRLAVSGGPTASQPPPQAPAATGHHVTQETETIDLLSSDDDDKPIAQRWQAQSPLKPRGPQAAPQGQPGSSTGVQQAGPAAPQQAPNAKQAQPAHAPISRMPTAHKHAAEEQVQRNAKTQSTHSKPGLLQQHAGTGQRVSAPSAPPAPAAVRLPAPAPVPAPPPQAAAPAARPAPVSSPAPTRAAVPGPAASASAVRKTVTFKNIARLKSCELGQAAASALPMLKRALEEAEKAYVVLPRLEEVASWSLHLPQQPSKRLKTLEEVTQRWERAGKPASTTASHPWLTRTDVHALAECAESLAQVAAPAQTFMEEPGYGAALASLEDDLPALDPEFMVPGANRAHVLDSDSQSTTSQSQVGPTPPAEQPPSPRSRLGAPVQPQQHPPSPQNRPDTQQPEAQQAPAAARRPSTAAADKFTRPEKAIQLPVEDAPLVPRSKSKRQHLAEEFDARHNKKSKISDSGLQDAGVLNSNHRPAGTPAAGSSRQAAAAAPPADRPASSARPATDRPAPAARPTGTGATGSQQQPPAAGARPVVEVGVKRKPTGTREATVEALKKKSKPSDFRDEDPVWQEMNEMSDLGAGPGSPQQRKLAQVVAAHRTAAGGSQVVAGTSRGPANGAAGGGVGVGAGKGPTGGTALPRTGSDAARDKSVAGPSTMQRQGSDAAGKGKAPLPAGMQRVGSDAARQPSGELPRTSSQGPTSNSQQPNNPNKPAGRPAPGSGAPSAPGRGTAGAGAAARPPQLQIPSDPSQPGQQQAKSPGASPAGRSPGQAAGSGQARNKGAASGSGAQQAGQGSGAARTLEPHRPVLAAFADGVKQVRAKTQAVQGAKPAAAPAPAPAKPFRSALAMMREQAEVQKKKEEDERKLPLAWAAETMYTMLLEAGRTYEAEERAQRGDLVLEYDFQDKVLEDGLKAKGLINTNGLVDIYTLQDLVDQGLLGHAWEHVGVYDNQHISRVNSEAGFDLRRLKVLLEEHKDHIQVMRQFLIDRILPPPDPRYTAAAEPPAGPPMLPSSPTMNMGYSPGHPSPMNTLGGRGSPGRGYRGRRSPRGGRQHRSPRDDHGPPYPGGSVTRRNSWGHQHPSQHDDGPSWQDHGPPQRQPPLGHPSAGPSPVWGGAQRPSPRHPHTHHLPPPGPPPQGHRPARQQSFHMPNHDFARGSTPTDNLTPPVSPDPYPDQLDDDTGPTQPVQPAGREQWPPAMPPPHHRQSLDGHIAAPQAPPAPQPPMVPLVLQPAPQPVAPPMLLLPLPGMAAHTAGAVHATGNWLLDQAMLLGLGSLGMPPAPFAAGFQAAHNAGEAPQSHLPALLHREALSDAEQQANKNKLHDLLADLAKNHGLHLPAAMTGQPPAASLDAAAGPAAASAAPAAEGGQAALAKAVERGSSVRVIRVKDLSHFFKGQRTATPPKDDEGIPLALLAQDEVPMEVDEDEDLAARPEGAPPLPQEQFAAPADDEYAVPPPPPSDAAQDADMGTGDQSAGHPAPPLPPPPLPGTGQPPPLPEAAATALPPPPPSSASPEPPPPLPESAAPMPALPTQAPHAPHTVPMLPDHHHGPPVLPDFGPPAVPPGRPPAPVVSGVANLADLLRQHAVSAPPSGPPTVGAPPQGLSQVLGSQAPVLPVGQEPERGMWPPAEMHMPPTQQCEHPPQQMLALQAPLLPDLPGAQQHPPPALPLMPQLPHGLQDMHGPPQLPHGLQDLHGPPQLPHGLQDMHGPPQLPHGLQDLHGPPQLPHGLQDMHGPPQLPHGLQDMHGPPQLPHGLQDMHGPPQLPHGLQDMHGPPQLPHGLQDMHGPPQLPHGLQDIHGPPQLPHGLQDLHGPPQLPHGLQDMHGPPQLPHGLQDMHGPPQLPHGLHGPPQLPHGLQDMHGPPQLPHGLQDMHGPPQLPHGLQDLHGPPQLPHGLQDLHGPPQLPHGLQDRHGPPQLPQGPFQQPPPWLHHMQHPGAAPWLPGQGPPGAVHGGDEAGSEPDQQRLPSPLSVQQSTTEH